MLFRSVGNCLVDLLRTFFHIGLFDIQETLFLLMLVCTRQERLTSWLCHISPPANWALVEVAEKYTPCRDVVALVQQRVWASEDCRGWPHWRIGVWGRDTEMTIGSGLTYGGARRDMIALFFQKLRRAR